MSVIYAAPCAACPNLATQVALMQIENPSDAHPTGIQEKRLYCEPCADWSGAWGYWPMENDEVYGIPLGAAGKPMYELEVKRQFGNVTDEEYWDTRDRMIADAEPAHPGTRRWSLVHKPREVRATERALVEANAAGRIVDPVPVGSDSGPNWTRQTESPIRRAERAVREGRRAPEFAPALVNEVSRRIKHQAERALHHAYLAIHNLIQAEDLPVCDMIEMSRRAEQRAAGVSLAK